MKRQISSIEDMADFGIQLGGLLVGGTLIELVGDVGAGKTTLAKAIARGMGVTDNVQSPSFTISQVYEAHNNLRLAHYDFYRLENAGIMHSELSEVVHDQAFVTLIEWGGIVQGVLPEDRITITILPVTETSRELSLEAHGVKSAMIEAQL